MFINPKPFLFLSLLQYMNYECTAMHESGKKLSGEQLHVQYLKYIEPSVKKIGLSEDLCCLISAEFMKGRLRFMYDMDHFPSQLFRNLFLNT